MQNNPINRIDPTGAIDDHININKSTGHISIEENSNSDIVQLIGGDGRVESSYEYGKSGSFKNDTKIISGGFTDTEGNFSEGTAVAFFNTSNAFDFFKFAAKSDVEFGYTEVKGNIKAAIVATSHDEGSERFGSIFKYKALTETELKISSIWHSHPGKHNKNTNWPAYPSGFNNRGEIDFNYKGGDRGEVMWQRKWFPNRTPKTNHIFVPSSNTIIEYNSSLYNIKDND